MQAQKVNGSCIHQKDFVPRSCVSEDSFGEKDDSVIFIEEKKGRSQDPDVSVIEIDCDIANLSIIEIDHDVSVPDIQECSTIPSKCIKNVQKKKQITSAFHDVDIEIVNNSITSIGSAVSKFDAQVVKLNSSEKTTVTNKSYKKHKKRRLISRKNKKRISIDRTNTIKYKTPQILKTHCKRNSKHNKSSKIISMINSGAHIKSEKSFNHLQEKQIIPLTLTNIKDTPTMHTTFSETGHSVSCDKCNTVNCKKCNDWKGQIDSKKITSVLQDNASVPLSQRCNSSVETVVPVQMKKLRPIVIDGSNIAMSHGKPRKVFSCRGIELAINYFHNRGHHDIAAFVPQRRRSKSWSNKITDQHLLEALGDKQLIVFTPSRKINEKFVSSYDDRFIVDLATRNGGVIVSNDNYRDIMNERSDWKETVKKRLLMYCFVGDHFMVPSDPLGKNGPHLDDFLAF